MLYRLNIKNYAILESVEVEFEPGLNIITGETGAGKSIIIGSLGLILGEPASVSVIRKGAKKAIVEGTFVLKKNHAALTLLKENDLLEDSDSVLLRREVHLYGRSRCFINDSPVNLALLRQLGDMLVDLHGQHQHQSLLKIENYYDLLDRFGELTEISQKAAEYYFRLKELSFRARELNEKSKTAKERRELAEFQLNEILRIDPKPKEDEDLEREIRIAENVEQLWEHSLSNYETLYEKEGSAAEQISTVIKNTEELESIDSSFGDIKSELESALMSLQEAANFFLRYKERQEFGPERLEEARRRLSILIGFKKKYGKSLEAVLHQKTKLENELSLTSNIENQIVEINKNISGLTFDFIETCMELSKERTKAAAKMSKQITDTLKALGMEYGNFQVIVNQRLHPQGEYTFKNKRFNADQHGMDSIDFLIATNKGEDLKFLHKIASGGEISRVMLAVKSALAEIDNIPVLIFDEIDTGISGRMAIVVGRHLRGISKLKQLICITHLPQIAGIGNVQFSAVKKEKGGRVSSNMKKLNYKERKFEIAKLLGGEKVTETSLKNAEELMEGIKRE